MPRLLNRTWQPEPRTLSIQSLTSWAPKPYLPRIPDEILLQICLYLHDIQDIGRLRQTCHRLYLMISEKAIWRPAFRRACHSHNIIFPLSSSVSAPSVDQLEHVATGQHKFSARLREAAQSFFLSRSSGFGSNVNSTRGAVQLPPSNTREIECGTKVMVKQKIQRGTKVIFEEALKGGYTSLALVPGGRFLVAHALGHVLELWDLTSPTLDRQAALRATFALPVVSDEDQAHVTLRANATAKGGKGLIIVSAVVRSLKYDMDETYLVYSVDPAEANPRFEQVGYLDPVDVLPEDRKSCGSRLLSESDCLVVRWQRSALLWNYKDNTLASIQFPRDYHSHVCEISIINNTLVFWGTYFISTCDLPQFCPRGSSQLQANFSHLSRTVLSNDPRFCAGLAFASPHPYIDLVNNTASYSFLRASKENGLNGSNIHCCAVSFERAEGQLMTRITHKQDWPSNHPIKKLHRNHIMTHDLPHQDQALMWMDLTMGKVAFKVLHGAQEVDVEILDRPMMYPGHKKGFVHHDEKGELVSIAICTFSGRFCYMANPVEVIPGDELGGPRIHVVDFV